MKITLENGRVYEISEDEKQYRVDGGEWRKAYSIDAHPKMYIDRKLLGDSAGYSAPAPGLYLSILAKNGSVEPASKIHSVLS